MAPCSSFQMSDDHDERNWLVTNLKDLTTRRSKLLEVIHVALPPRVSVVVDSSFFFHFASVFSTVTLIVVVFAKIRSLTLFSMHPLCMIMGTLLCLSQGIVAFRNKFLLETLSPIMQHNKKTKTRVIHQTMHMLGASFLVLGLLFIAAHKVEEKHSLLPMTIHSIIGFCALMILCVQATSGMQKMEEFVKSDHPRKIKRWHGESGLVLWDLLCLSLITGSYSLLGLFSKTAFLSLVSVGVIWVATYAQMRRKFPEDTGGLLERIPSQADFGGEDWDDSARGNQAAIEDP